MFSVAELVTVTNGKLIGPDTGSVYDISTDSRTIAAGQLFVPLQGETFDGHDYIAAVSERQVQVCLCAENWLKQHTLPDGISCIVVPDTLRALGDIAASYRRKFELPLIGVTGSNGKTTTKEMLAAILGQTGPGLKTSGNLNNLIGLPQMVLKLRPEHQWAVLEMGMSEPGEIDRLAEIAFPSVGIILNAFPAHLQSMGTVEAVAQAKGELLHRIQDGGLAVVNADDPRIASLPQNPSARRISFGIRRGEVRAEAIRSLGIEGQEFSLVTPKGTTTVRLAAFGHHNIYNALAASAALIDSLPLSVISAGLAAFTPYNGRFRLEQLADSTILIDDSYNANPASCAAALTTLQELKNRRRAVVVLGDMLELGPAETELHHAIGMQAAQVADRLYLLGTLAAHIATGAQEAGMAGEHIIQASDHATLTADIIRHAAPGDIILIKGSRGMQMEKITAAIRAAQHQEN